MTAPLRIAVFAHFFPALSETFVLNEITGLIDRGCEVVILANEPRSEGVEHEDLTRYGLTERTVYPDLPRGKLSRIVAAIPLVLGFIRPGRWHQLRCLNVLRYGIEARSLLLLFWAARLNRLGGEFDVIHCHFGQTGRLGSYLREIGVLRGRLVTTFHGVDVSAAIAGDRDAYSHLFHNGDLFLPISRRWRDRLLDLGCPERITQVHRMGVDLKRFPMHVRRQGPDAVVRLLTVGRLVEKKGVVYALEAVSRLSRRGVAVRYTIVGDGPQRALLEARCKELGIEEFVQFLGWRDADAVVNLMLASDILVAPSVTATNGDQEGIPVTIMEAMATGMPVITTRHSGIPELVDEGVTGYLVPERDSGALADALYRIYAQPDLWEAFGRAARQKVAEEFNIDLLNDRLVTIFDALARSVDGPAREPSTPQRTRRAFTFPL